MINQQEKRPLSVGSAVQFTHKGKTIHGHLLQRQGRRRFAQVVDREERTWKVPESALKHSGGARLDQPQDRGEGRMINQQEKRPLSVGSAVQFTHKGKTIHGHLLQRQGRRRFAQVVDREERTWKVPESALKQ